MGGLGFITDGFGQLNHGGYFHQSQSQFSEFEDNMSSVVINYDNLTGLLNNRSAARVNEN
jgi:hypothetical protein